MRPLAVAPHTRPRRLAFLGSPREAVPALRNLVAAGYEVVLVVTQPDRRRGRGGATRPSPVKAAAHDLGIPVSHTVDDLLESGAELGVLVAYGRLVRRHVLEAMPVVNVHFSLLPRWRGAAPVERAILAGDRETGVCLMQLVEELDAGPVYGCRPVPILPSDDAATLSTRLAEEGGALLLELLAAGLPEPRPQVGEATYADKVGPGDFALDWGLAAEVLARIVRAGAGRAHTTFRGRRLKVHAAEPLPSGPAPGVLEDGVVGTGDGGLRLVRVQAEGGADQPAEAWLRGARLAAGERLGA